MKHNLKNGIKLGVIIFAIMLIIPCNIKAADTSGSEMKGGKSSAGNSAANAACRNAIFYSEVFSEREDKENYYLTFKVKEGYWKLRLYYGDDINYIDVFGDANTTAKDPSRSETVSSKEATFVIPKDEYDEQQLFVIAELAGYDSNGTKIGYNSEKKPLRVTYNGDKTTTCRYGTVGSNKNRVKIDGTGAFYRTTIKPKNTGRPTVTLANINDQKIINECTAMQQGLYNFGEKNSDLDIPGIALNEYKAGMVKSFPYCFGKGSSYAYTAKDIEDVRHASIDAYREYYKLVNNNTQNLGGYANLNDYETEEVVKKGYIKIDFQSKDETKIKTLQCTKDQLDSVTKKYYVRNNNEVKNDYCSVDCLEQIQVVYDPPVASKAGLCFQYKVTVRSKVTCEAKINGGFEWPTPPSPCEFSAICNGNSNETQAGPNETFDSCVNSCDNGAYSQSCINKCYKKVYKNSNSKTKKTSTSVKNKTSIKNANLSKSKNSSSLLKLSNTNGQDPYYNINGCQNNTEISNNIDECAKQFYLLKQSDPRGEYTFLSPNPGWYTHTWNPDETVDPTSGTPAGLGGDSAIESIKRAASYYFRSLEVSKKTIQSFYGRNNGKNGYGKDRYYIIDNGGIKRQKGSYNCSEVCGFVSSGNNNNCVNSSTDAASYLVDIFNTRYGQLTQCSANAKCKESEADFKIQVKKRMKENKDDYKEITWDAYNKTNNDGKTCNSPGSYTDKYNIKMFIPLQGSIIDNETYSDKEVGGDECTKLKNGINGKCYGKDEFGYWQHYKTTITFPGTWIDLKTGRRYYTDDGVDTTITREKPNYYCTGYDEEDVNRKWWDWKINENDKNKNKAPTPEKNDNITASVEKFGKYNWKFNLNCFYAINNTVTTCTGKDCNPSCEGAECNTTIDNVRLRPVDQANLFAGRSGDQVGFNWTSAAQDTVASKVKDNSKAKSYGIDPGKYAENLQKESKNNSEAAYSGDIEYSFHLTKENIKELRNYAKKNGYTSYNGTNKNEVKEIGLYYYESKILDNSDKYVSSLNRNTTLGCNGKECK